MPNWCNNHLKVIGPKREILRFVNESKGKSPWSHDGEDENILNFYSHIPFPEGLVKGIFDDETYNRVGYKWEHSNFGCKWGACQADICSQSDNEVMYGFDTAWSPPDEWLEFVSGIYPKLTFELTYYEPGEGYRGLTRIKDGEVLEEEDFTGDEYYIWTCMNDKEEWEYMKENMEEEEVKKYERSAKRREAKIHGGHRVRSCA
jgi:hypothetical protein